MCGVSFCTCAEGALVCHTLPLCLCQCVCVCVCVRARARGGLPVRVCPCFCVYLPFGSNKTPYSTERIRDHLPRGGLFTKSPENRHSAFMAAPHLVHTSFLFVLFPVVFNNNKKKSTHSVSLQCSATLKTSNASYRRLQAAQTV